MPFINSRITCTLSVEKEKILRERLSQIIVHVNANDDHFMAGFSDNYDLYLGTDKLERGAFVDVHTLRVIPADVYKEMTEEICELFKKELDISGEHLYVAYYTAEAWGWNSKMF